MSDDGTVERLEHQPQLELAVQTLAHILQDTCASALVVSWFHSRAFQPHGTHHSTTIPLHVKLQQVINL